MRSAAIALLDQPLERDNVAVPLSLALRLDGFFIHHEIEKKKILLDRLRWEKKKNKEKRLLRKSPWNELMELMDKAANWTVSREKEIKSARRRSLSSLSFDGVPQKLLSEKKKKKYLKRVLMKSSKLKEPAVH